MKGVSSFIFLFLFSGYLYASNPSGSIISSVTRFPADGKSSGRLTYTASHSEKGGLKGPFGKKESLKIVARESDGSGEHLFFRSTGIPGEVWFEGDDGSKLGLTFYKTGPDIDEDGFPDVSELDTEEDRNSFREWFVRIAESQFLKHNASWNDAERDCAGLIRYSYREALKQHDNAWLLRSGLVVDKNISDIQKFHYPDIPGIGENIFKIRSGSAEDMASFGAFADAQTLSKFNVGFVSRSPADAKKGDILFFRIEGRGKVQFHSMIVASAGTGPMMLIYHTGRQDVIKRVEAGYLKDSGAFSPDEKNERFLGVFRFHILE